MKFKSFIPLSALLLCSFLAPFTYAKSHKAKNSSTDSTTVTIPTEKRNVPTSVKNEVYKSNGISKSERKNYVIDHKVPLELGGSNSKENLQPQKKAEAKTKDKWENYLTSEVKAGKMSLGQAQSEIQQTHTSSPPKQ